MKKLLATFLCFAILAIGIVSPAKGTDAKTDYRQVPGLTQAEAEAIEALQKEGRILNYGALLSAEAFLDKEGNVSGYTARLCALLSRLFGIPVTPALYEWEAIVNGLEDTSLSFSG